MPLNKPITASEQPSYTLWQLVRYFLYLGYAGFGGPVALVGYMHRDLVEHKKWISEEDYKEGMTLAQLAPGPMAAQLGIYIGYIDYKVLGATLAGLAFVLPSFLMVVVLGIIYSMYGGGEWMQNIFYGVGACVVGIILISSYRLTTKTVGKFSAQSFRKNWMLWLFYFSMAVITIITKTENILLFLGFGLFYMFTKAPPKFSKSALTKSVMLMVSASGIVWSTGSSNDLWNIALFFAEAGSFVFGSGLAIVPFLHSGVVTQFHWLNEKQFLDAVAVAMITPGPVVITVGFIGYLEAGVLGATVAALATFLPCYLLTIFPAPYMKKYGKNVSIKAFVDGITAAVVGALSGAVIIIAINTFTQNHTVTIDIPSVLIAFATAIILLRTKKIQEPLLILAAALIGLLIKQF